MDPVLAELLAKHPPVHEQHFVPRFHLARWADGDGRIAVFYADTKRIRARKASPKTVCKVLYYYGTRAGANDDEAQLTELVLWEMEDKLRPIVDRIIPQILTNQQATRQDKYNLALLMSMLWIRGPVMREKLRLQKQQVYRDVMQIAMAINGDHYIADMERDSGKQFAPEFKAKLKQAFADKDYELHWSNQDHLLMIGRIPNFANVLAMMTWKIYISEGAGDFITSDNPVFEQQPDKYEIGRPPLWQNMYWFPLTPKILICAHELAKEGAKPYARKRLYRDRGGRMVVYANSIMARGCKWSAYATEKQSFQDVLDATPKKEDDGG